MAKCKGGKRKGGKRKGCQLIVRDNYISFNEESGTPCELSWPSRDLLFSFYILRRGFIEYEKIEN